MDFGYLGMSLCKLLERSLCFRIVAISEGALSCFILLAERRILRGRELERQTRKRQTYQRQSYKPVHSASVPQEKQKCPASPVTFIGCVGVSFTNPDQEKTRQGVSWRAQGDYIIGSKGNLAA